MNKNQSKATKSLIFAAVALMVLFAAGDLCAQSSEEDAVKNAVQTFFDAIGKKSAEIAKSVLYKDGLLHSVKEADNDIVVSTTPHQTFIEKLPSFEGDLLEKMYDPKVLIHGKIAVVWTKYTFHRDGKFSHRGMDAVQLVKTNEGWKICGILYTVEPE